jgi:predicted esterase
MTALEVCVEALIPVNLASLESTTNFLASLNLIDGLKNITAMPVYLFHGLSDRTVFAPVNDALYQNLLDYGADVVYNNATQANHAWISRQSRDHCIHT